MKRLAKIVMVFFLGGTLGLTAQTAGINYQALILDNEEIEVPGQNISQNQVPLRSEAVNFRFSISRNSDNSILYMEEQSTVTDANGLISLVVGSGTPILGTFDSMVWNGTPKTLDVEIDIVRNGEGFVFLDSQQILYLPQSVAAPEDVTTAGNGLSKNGDTIELGGVLTLPTTVRASQENTLAITGLETGDLIEDRLVVMDRNTGVLKQVTAPTLVSERQSLILAVDGQTRFTPPLPVSDAEKVNVYRNGIRIDFTVVDTSTIELESGVVCFEDDEIRIVQFQ